MTKAVAAAAKADGQWPKTFAQDGYGSTLTQPCMWSFAKCGSTAQITR